MKRALLPVGTRGAHQAGASAQRQQGRGFLVIQADFHQQPRSCTRAVFCFFLGLCGLQPANDHSPAMQQIKQGQVGLLQGMPG
jgi:hypothetical protein